MTNERIYIKEAAKQLNRREATIRGWEREGILPEELVAHRDEKEWRFWTEDQIEKIKVWLEENDMRPGKGLINYKPTKEKLRQHIQNQRKKV